jgi:hypothetical protein
MLSVDEDTQTHAPELSDWRPPAEMHLDEVLRSHDIDLTTVEDIYPATPMQVYMVGAWQLSGGSVFYATHSYLFHHDCEIGTIHAAWREVVRTNAILRTQLVSTLSKDIPLVQVILKEGYDSDRSTVSPMVRLVATWNEERRGWMLNLKIHHALYDGVSLPAILEQFRHYAFAINVKFEESRVKRELSLWKHHCTLPTLEANRISRRQFWENYLLGCDQKLPGDGLARPDQSNERASYLRRSALADTTELRRAANKHGVSVQSIFLAAYAQIIAASQVQDEASKQQVIVMGLYLANRSHGRGEAEVPSTYPSLSLVPLKVVIRKGLSLLHVASEVHKDIIKISSEGYVDVGLWEIATWTGVKISTFVNFLSLPDGGEDRNSDENAKSQIEPVGEVPQSNDGRSQEDELSGVKPIVVRDDFLVCHTAPTMMNNAMY